jgi:uncharacterized membrane protein
LKSPPSQFIVLLTIVWLALPATTMAQASGDPVVQAVLFYSPSCPHCHTVITELLVPMVERYGSDRLQIIGIDTTLPGGGELYLTTIERYEIPRARQAVPTLIVGDVLLVGGEIPDQFPALVEEGLNSNGIDWPEIPGLDQVIPPEVKAGASPTAEPQPTPTRQPTTTKQSATTKESTTTKQPTATVQPTVTTLPTATPMPSPTPIDIPTSTPTPAGLAFPVTSEELSNTDMHQPPPDPVGFAIAGAVLVGMLAATGYAMWRVMNVWPGLLQLQSNTNQSAQTWAIPILALLGLGVASYLAYVEITRIQAVCGPVGECNIVQSSPYARILGIPIAVLGALNYVAVGTLWAGQKPPDFRWAKLSALGLLGLTFFGTLFSIYLTCLELFVIRAVCAWCISSAVITSLLMLLAVTPITSKQS